MGHERTPRRLSLYSDSSRQFGVVGWKMKKGPGSSTNTPALFIGWEQTLICGGQPGLQPKKALGEHVIKSGCLLATDRQDIFHRHHDSIITVFLPEECVGRLGWCCLHRMELSADWQAIGLILTLTWFAPTKETLLRRSTYTQVLLSVHSLKDPLQLKWHCIRSVVQISGSNGLCT